MPFNAWLPRGVRGRLGRLAGADDDAAAGGAEELTPQEIRPRRARPVVVGQPRPTFVVCGNDSLAHHLIEELTTRYGADVTAIVASRSRDHGPQISRLPGVRLIESEKVDGQALRLARVNHADALALVQQDDVGNIHAALTAQELNPDLRLVIRMFNVGLGAGIRRLFADCAVISDAEMAAPAFVAAALGEVAPNYVRVFGRTLLVARRADVPAQRVLCDLADTRGEEPVLLPDRAEDADLVLAVADGAAPLVNSAQAATVPNGLSVPALANRWRRRRARRHTWRSRLALIAEALTVVVGRKLYLATAALVAVLIAGTAALAAVQHQSIWDAGFTTLLITVSGASPEGPQTPFTQVFQTLVTLAGLALIPVVTAAVVEAVVNARLAQVLGRLRSPVADHVVVVGLGNVGTRVIRQLHDLGVATVAVDVTDTARGAQIARDLKIPLIVGDAAREETLRAASVQTASALVVLSTDDVTNLEAALHARNLRPDLRVVLRFFDGDFAHRVQEAFDITSSRSVSFLAAPAFAAAMHERQVIGTIPVERQVLMLSEVPVGSGSDLDGATVGSVDQTAELRVLAMLAEDGRTVVWNPTHDRVLCDQDLLIVVASRRGLGDLVTRAQRPRSAGSSAELPAQPARSDGAPARR